MSRAQELLRRIQKCLGGYQVARPGSAMPRSRDLGGGCHRLFCGNPREQSPGGNGFVFRNTGYALAFELFAEERDEGFCYRSFSIHLMNVGEGTLMFHKSPEAARWPEHPEAHIQFDAPEQTVRSAPFLGWRIPLGEIDPVKCVEYAAALGAGP